MAVQSAPATASPPSWDPGGKRRWRHHQQQEEGNGLKAAANGVAAIDPEKDGRRPLTTERPTTHTDTAGGAQLVRALPPAKERLHSRLCAKVCQGMQPQSAAQGKKEPSKVLVRTFCCCIHILNLFIYFQRQRSLGRGTAGSRVDDNAETLLMRSMTPPRSLFVHRDSLF